MLNILINLLTVPLNVLMKMLFKAMSILYFKFIWKISFFKSYLKVSFIGTRSKLLVRNFDNFTDGLYGILIKWVKKKVKQLFQRKCKNSPKSCAIYEGKCTCKESSISETRCNVEIG